MYLSVYDNQLGFRTGFYMKTNGMLEKALNLSRKIHQTQSDCHMMLKNHQTEVRLSIWKNVYMYQYIKLSVETTGEK
jgi:hypothetical protein